MPRSIPRRRYLGKDTVHEGGLELVAHLEHPDVTLDVSEDPLKVGRHRGLGFTGIQLKEDLQQ